jgi:hypothetical protein
MTRILSRLVIAVIGTRWLGKTENNETRIAQPDDPVRLELEVALESDAPLLPVLVEEAKMPRATELPETPRPLVKRNATVIDLGRDIGVHIQRLIRRIDEIVDR